MAMKRLYKKLKGPNGSNYAREKDVLGNLALHTVCGYFASDYDGDLVKFLLKLYPEGIKMKDHEGKLPIHILASSNHYDSVDPLIIKNVFQMLIEQFPEGLKVKCRYGNLPLHRAVSNHWSETIKLLAEAYPESLQEANAEGRLPLHCCLTQHCSNLSGSNTIQTLQFLVSAFPDATKHPDSGGNLPIHCSTRSLEEWKVVLHRHPGSLRVPNRAGKLPLHRIALFSPSNLVEQCYKEYPEAARAHDHGNQLPIEIAITWGKQDNISTLAKLCPDTLEIVKCKHTKSACACHAKHPIMDFLSGTTLAKWRCGVVRELLKHSTSKQDSDSDKDQKINELEQRLQTSQNARKEAQQDLLNEKKKELEESMRQEEEKVEALLKENTQLQERNKCFETETSALKAKADIADALGQSLLESRKSEGAFFSRLMKHSKEWSVEDLKSAAKSLETRLDKLKRNLKPNIQPSTAQRMLPYLLKEASPSKDFLLQFIETLDSELSDCESTLVAPNNSGTTTTTTTRSLEGSPVNASRKRVRISVSPEGSV